jgi:hypothetical protein
LARGERWVLEDCRWRYCSKPDLLTLVGFSSIRTFLLRSSALSGHDGHPARPCSCSARDQHMPGVFLSTLARMGYGLLFRLRKVPIWTSEGRLTFGGFPEKACEGVCSTRAGFRRFFFFFFFFFFFSGACILGFSSYLMYILILFHSLPFW